MSSERVKIADHPTELERKNIEAWLIEFLPKLGRTTTRTQRCRILESIERMQFKDDLTAAKWEYVQFTEKGLGEISGKDRQRIEDFAVTKLQKTIQSCSS